MKKNILLILFILLIHQLNTKEVIIRFAWWGNEERSKVTQTTIDLYMKKNPDVKIIGEIAKSAQDLRYKLKKELENGTAPEIFQFDVKWEYDLTEKGSPVKNYILDLKKFKQIETTSFDKEFLEEWCVLDEKLLGLPTGVNLPTFLINKSLFKKFNLKQDIVWNWNNLLEIGAEIHKKDSSMYLMAGSFNLIYDLLKSYALNLTGGEWIKDDYTIDINKSVLTETFSYFQKLIDNGVIPSFEEMMISDYKFENYPKWISGKILIMLSVTSLISNFKRPGFEYSVTLPPFLKGAKNTGLIVRPTQILSGNKNSKNQDEIVKFINWFINSPEAAVILGVTRSIPASSIARKVLADKEIIEKDLANATMLSIMYAGKYESPLVYPVEITDIMIEKLKKLENKKITPEKAAEEYLNQVQIKLNELKKAKR